MSIKIKIARTAVVVLVTAFSLRQQLSPLRSTVAAAMTAVSGVWISLAAGSTAPFDRTLVVAFLVLAPTLPLIRLLPNVSGTAALVVGAAGATVINILVAQFMLATDAWSTRAGVITIGLIAALLFLVPTHRPQPRPTGKRGAE
jgi:hypothetical protein